MSVYSDLDAILRAQIDQPEYWSEFGLDASARLAVNMTESDRLRLREAWSTELPEWRLRAANFLAYADPAWSIPLLVDLLRVSHGDVYRRLLESLHEFSAEASRERLTPSDWVKMEQAGAASEGIEGVVIRKLLGRLRH